MFSCCNRRLSDKSSYSQFDSIRVSPDPWGDQAARRADSVSPSRSLETSPSARHVLRPSSAPPQDLTSPPAYSSSSCTPGTLVVQTDMQFFTGSQTPEGSIGHLKFGLLKANQVSENAQTPRQTRLSLRLTGTLAICFAGAVDVKPGNGANQRLTPPIKDTKLIGAQCVVRLSVA